MPPILNEIAGQDCVDAAQNLSSRHPLTSPIFMTSSIHDADIGYDVPAAIGDTLDDVQTPALIIDLDAFERNVARMKTYAGTAGIRLRPHAKTHKSADIALYQMQSGGAIGICCQKVSEAEALVRGGVTDVLVVN